MDIVTEKKDITREFYELMIRYQKLLVGVHFIPFVPDWQSIATTEEMDGINLQLRCDKEIIMRDADKIMKQIENKPVSINGVPTGLAIILLRYYRLMVGIHFHCDTGEHNRLKSLSTPDVKKLEKNNLTSDMEDFIEKLKQPREAI